MTHPSDVDLLDVIEDVADPVTAGATKAHVSGCRDCRARMVSLVGHYMDVGMLDEVGHDPQGHDPGA